MTVHIVAGPWRRAPHDRRREPGFSLLELCAVLMILMIVGAMVFVNAVNVMRSIRLHQSAVSYANLLQRARIRAVTDDNFYTVQTGTYETNPIAYADLDKSGTYGAPEPMVVSSQGVTYMAFGSGPNVTNLESQFLPPGQGGTVVTDNGPTFGSRGLPCKVTGGTCSYITGGVATSYITFLQNSDTTKWEAVTVSPAGRIRIWSYEGTTWSPKN